VEFDYWDGLAKEEWLTDVFRVLEARYCLDVPSPRGVGPHCAQSHLPPHSSFVNPESFPAGLHTIKQILPMEKP
jgi:hypothetical protein